MECIEPGAISPEELIAYADGEASPAVAAHVAACPACAATAAEYARFQRRLQAPLWRFDCPSPQTLGEYDLGLLTPEERTRVAMHVADCPRCADELRQFRQFMAADLPATPLGIAERARRIVATLLPQAGPAPALRGAGTTGSLTFSAGDLTITLDTDYDPRRRHGSLTGLILAGDAESPAGAPVALVAAGGAARAATVDELGNFAFEAVAPGTYRLEVTLGDDTVVVDGVRVGA